MKHRLFIAGICPGLVAASLTLCVGCTQAAPPVPSLSPVVAAQGAKPLAANVDKPIPPNGKPMVPSDGSVALAFSGTPEQGSGETVTVTGQPFATARRFTVLTKPANPWVVQATLASPGTLKKGDVLLAAFYIRAPQGQRETGEGRTQFVFERQGEPWTKYNETEVSAGKEWKRVFVPLVMTNDAPPETHVTFRLGFGAQILEIADFQFLNFGDTVKLADLPRTRSVYKGIEADAAWRKEAEARIEKIRKGNVTVVVKNAAGKVVPNASVSLAQTRHGFGFGTAVADYMISAQTPDGDKYREWVKKYCSKVVIENDLKWSNFEGDPAAAKRVVGWLNTNNIPVKGHNLVWGSYRFSPKDLADIGKDKPKLAKRINDHITQEVTALKGQIVEWDVINEPWDNHDFTDILGKEAMVDWFNQTKSLDPKPRLTLNDYPKPGEPADI
ncbi:MAG: endo-1,4-beta-xylanase, partial [Armatimonadetes bacterium]|nr:endo-1,4-beta-xylanase [Armatimonadota bacterium]